jgi:tetratricopeptide (TPR) repeat protein
MDARIISRLTLATAAAAVFVGAGWIGSHGLETTTTPAQAATASNLKVAATSPTPAFDPAFYLCHTPSATMSAAAMGAIRSMQLAQAQTEVPPAEIKAAVPTPGFVDIDPPLWKGLGTVSMPITTASADAQKYFDQGVRLTYAFNHLEAQRAFRKAQKLDPNCAMCFWGEALVLGPNINLPMQDDAIAPAYAAARKALALSSKANARERALIDAVAARYSDDPKAERAKLDAAYAAAMEKAAKEHPNDNEVLTLYAESLMDLSPWNYWQKGGHEPNPHGAAIVPTLERVLARDPDHMGAIHLYIHAVEASDRPRRAEPYADRLRGKVPNAGHLVHMPSHIYYRVGRYLDALRDNKIAAAVDEKYLAETNAPPGVYRLGYYPHNVHFVLAAAQMSGDGPTVIAAAEKLRGLIPDEIARAIAITQPVKAAPYFAHALFSSPDTILALSDPGSAIPYVQAMWRYARGVAQVERRDLAAARAEAEAIGALERGDFTLLNASGVPAQDVLKLARAVILGRIAQAEGDRAAAIARFEEAAALQDSLPYMEPPYWYYPVRQSLATALLQAGRLDEAEDQFLLALRRAPNNGWSYFGLRELYARQGNADRARSMDAELDKTWIGSRELLQLSKL